MTTTQRRNGPGVAAFGLAAVLCLAAATGAATASAGTGAATPPLPARSPDQRQVLTDLSYGLGESHALRRTCLGPSDRQWYDRMQRLLLIEAPDADFRRVLVERFNAGFLAAGGEFPRCTPDSRAAAHDAAERGKDLADRLTGTAERH